MAVELLSLNNDEFERNIPLLIRQLRSDESFVDVTLVSSDGKQHQAHQVILASSSDFFRDILKNNNHPKPFIYMKGVNQKYLNLLVDYLYLGQCQVDSDSLEEFLKKGTELKIVGLTPNDRENQPQNDFRYYKYRFLNLIRPMTIRLCF